MIAIAGRSARCGLQPTRVPCRRPFFGVPGAEAFRRDLKDQRVELLDSGHFALEEDAARVAEPIKQTF